MVSIYDKIQNIYWKNEKKKFQSFFSVFSTKPNRISNTSSNPYKRRSISAGISRALDAKSIKSLIDDCEIVNLFRAESLEAGYILNILYNLDKLTEMKGQQSNDESQNIEEVFMNSFWEEINKFRVDESDGNDEDIAQIGNPSGEISSVTHTPNILSLDLSHSEGREESSMLSNDLMGEMDALLSMAFEQYATDTTHQIDTVADIDEESFNCHKLYER